MVILALGMTFVAYVLLPDFLASYRFEMAIYPVSGTGRALYRL